MFTLYRDNPTKAEMQTMDKNCLPIFKYFRPQRKSKILVHGFGDSAEDSLMFPLLRDGTYLRLNYYLLKYMTHINYLCKYSYSCYLY